MTNPRQTMKIYCETQVPWPVDRPHTDQNERLVGRFRNTSTAARLGVTP